MTKDEIIQMARQANIGWGEGMGGMDEFLEVFAKLVAAEEREACAKVCESKMTGINPLGDDYREECAEAIRARGETTSRGEA